MVSSTGSFTASCCMSSWQSSAGSFWPVPHSEGVIAENKPYYLYCNTWHLQPLHAGWTSKHVFWWEKDMLDIQYPVNYYALLLGLYSLRIWVSSQLTKTLLQVAWGCNPDFHIPAELRVSENQAFQPDGEPHVTAPNHILYLEVQELGREPKFLHHTCILPGCKPRLLFTEGRAERKSSFD